MNMANNIREPGCKGDNWTIEVPANSGGQKTQSFSKLFFVVSLQCVNAE